MVFFKVNSKDAISTPEAQLGPEKTSKMESSVTIVNDKKLLNIFAKLSKLNVSWDHDYISGVN